MMGMVGGRQALLSGQMQKKVSSKLDASQIVLIHHFQGFGPAEQFAEIGQDGLKMKIEEWGGGTLTLGPCFPNPGTLLAMPSLRDFEVCSPGTS